MSSTPSFIRTAPTCRHSDAAGREAALGRYHAALRGLPPPGSGAYRTTSFGAANHGIAAGLSDEDIAAGLRQHTRGGSRSVPDREIRETVRNARRTSWSKTGAPAPWRPHRPAPAPVDWDRIREGIISAGGGEADPMAADLWESSPVRIDWPPGLDAAEFVDRMYAPTEHLWVGPSTDAARGTDPFYCRTAAEWVSEFRQSPPPPPQFTHLVPNPVCGQPRPKKSNPNELSYRSLNAIAAWRYAVVEFDRDDMPKPRQLAFWRGLRLPNLAAVIDTGGKSLHVWLRLNARDAEHWDMQVMPMLRKLGPEGLGADIAGKTGGQLCRLPGVPRPEKRAMQRLLWLCPAGGFLP